MTPAVPNGLRPRPDTGIVPMPLTIVTGFLGSGKTTLLRRLLAVPSWRRTAVLMNEFGEEGLDHHLVEAGYAEPVRIDQGCACCTMIEPLRDAFYSLIAGLKRGGERANRIVLETSGLSDPAPIMATVLGDPVLREYLTPGGVVTTVDAVNASRQIANDADFRKQVAVADYVVVTKQDLAEPGTIASLRCGIADLNPAARLVEPGEPFELPNLLATVTGDATPSVAPGSSKRRRVCSKAPGHGDTQSFTLIYDRQVDWSAFVVWLTLLLHSHGEAVLRVKGILNVADADRPLVIQGVQHVMHPPAHLSGWPDDDRRSRIVFIVRGLDPDAIRRSLDRHMVWAASGPLPYSHRSDAA